MSNHLSDARLQAVADGEAAEHERSHVSTCAECRTRVTERVRELTTFRDGMERVSVPPELARRVNDAIAAAERRPGRTAGLGATTLRERASWRPRLSWVFAGGAVAAAVIAFVFVLQPSIDPGTRLNAAEILDKSLQTLSGSGTESLEYELTLTAPSTFQVQSGTYRIEQRIDHDGGRWLFGKYGADGTLLAGIAEDPTSGTRDAVVREAGRAYRFHFALGQGAAMPLWDVQRRYAETMIRVVQASGARVVSTEGDDQDRRYVIELPQDAARPASPLLDVSNARVVIDANDYHIIEFAAGGNVVGEPVSVAYRLVNRVVSAQAAGEDFALPHIAGEIELNGEGTAAIPRDVLAVLLREIGRR
jgi:hypothetical protein